MTIYSTVKNLLIVGKGKQEGKNGRIYYNAAVVSGSGEAGNFSVSEEVYNSIEPMKSYDFELEYSERGQYRFFTLNRLLTNAK